MHTKMKIDMRILAMGFVLSIGLFAAQAESGNRQGSPTEIVLGIQSISKNRPDQLSADDVKNLMAIVSSLDLEMHMPFSDGSESFEGIYHPPSSYAIWALSMIVRDPPMTYFDPDWQDGVHMTGERKRWADWWKENSQSFQLNQKPHERKEVPVELIATEKAAQDANFELYMKISKADAKRQAKQESGSYIELEQEYLFPKGASGLENLGIEPLINRSEEGGRPNAGKLGSYVPRSKEGDEHPGESSNLPKWALLGIMAAVIGILTVLVRAFLRSRAS